MAVSANEDVGWRCLSLDLMMMGVFAWTKSWMNWRPHEGCFRGWIFEMKSSARDELDSWLVKRFDSMKLVGAVLLLASAPPHLEVHQRWAQPSLSNR